MRQARATMWPLRPALRFSRPSSLRGARFGGCARLQVCARARLRQGRRARSHRGIGASYRMKMPRVNPQGKLFTCENNGLSGQISLLARGRSIRLEASSRKLRRNDMRETITAALTAATKAQDKRRISTLRLVSAAIKDRDIAARTAGKTQATDAELLELFAKMIKQREESQKIYADAGRAELESATVKAKLVG